MKWSIERRSFRNVKQWCVLMVGLGAVFVCNGQYRSVRDSSLFTPHIHVQGGVGFSGGDLHSRFGGGGVFGTGVHVKFRSGWYTGVNATFGFGLTLREPGVLSNLLTPNGQLIDNEGQVALLTLSGRSGLFTVEGGRLFSLPNKNPNTGVLVTVGLGSVHHRVHFENTENPITQLDQPYLSGYDRLTWGVAAREFVGYWHMSDDGLVNWFAGVELWQGRTWPQRPMNFDTQLTDEGPRFDQFSSFQVGWVFHIYKRTSVEHWN
ncbi:MAG: hypothetical protein ACO2XQ_08790 [Flavobacteriales bacterium]